MRKSAIKIAVKFSRWCTMMLHFLCWLCLFSAHSINIYCQSGLICGFNTASGPYCACVWWAPSGPSRALGEDTFFSDPYSWRRFALPVRSPHSKRYPIVGTVVFLYISEEWDMIRPATYSSSEPIEHSRYFENVNSIKFTNK